MQRREFNKALVGGALGRGLTAAIDTQPASAQARSSEVVTRRKNTLMHVGADYHYIAGGYPRSHSCGERGDRSQLIGCRIRGVSVCAHS